MIPENEKIRDPLFFAKVEEDSNGCWLWKAHIGTGGYGYLTRNSKTWKAHRYAYTISIGKIPKGLNVCHKCDVRNCVNPAHLFLGTQLDNMRDCVKKGRFSRSMGPKTGFKYSKETILEIRKMHSKGIRTPLISKKFGIDNSYVHQIIKREVWNRV